jgi:hypothetical protein
MGLLAFAFFLVRWRSARYRLVLTADGCPACDPFHGSIQPNRRQPAYRHLAACFHQYNPDIPAGIFTCPEPLDLIDVGDGTLDVAISTDLLVSSCVEQIKGPNESASAGKQSCCKEGRGIQSIEL